jgi:hypothetical protein
VGASDPEYGLSVIQGVCTAMGVFPGLFGLDLGLGHEVVLLGCNPAVTCALGVFVKMMNGGAKTSRLGEKVGSNQAESRCYVLMPLQFAVAP